jgi:RAT1-interacting protein
MAGCAGSPAPVVRANRPDYGSPAYWNNRYAESHGLFDWYRPWSFFEPLVSDLLQGAEDALNLGCGNSAMGADLARRFRTVVNIDIAAVVIEKMASEYSKLANVKWLVMDLADLQFPDGSFDAVLDKGTLDALFCAYDPTQAIERALGEIHRVLRPCGHFISITYGQPESRLPAFEAAGLGWRTFEPLMIENEEKSARHWIYRFRKLPGGELDR